MKTLETHRELINRLRGDWDFYTFTPKSQKQRDFVLQGLGNDVTASELQEELIDANLGVQKCFKRHSTRTTLFMVSFGPSHTRVSLNKAHPTINHIKVKWQIYKNKKAVIQCKNCQAWKHATSNCYVRADTCAKCAKAHATSACKKQPGDPAG